MKYVSSSSSVNIVKTSKLEHFKCACLYFTFGFIVKVDFKQSIVSV